MTVELSVPSPIRMLDSEVIIELEARRFTVLNVMEINHRAVQFITFAVQVIEHDRATAIRAYSFFMPIAISFQRFSRRNRPTGPPIPLEHLYTLIPTSIHLDIETLSEDT